MCFSLLEEEVINRLHLLFDAWQYVHFLAEGRRANQPLGVPGDVLAGDLEPRFRAVESVEVFEMREQDAVDLGDPGRRQVLAGFQKVLDLAEQPGPALCGATAGRGPRSHADCTIRPASWP